MVPAHLQRVDPEANMARFYRVEVAPTLFGEVAVLRSWGRIGTRGRTSIETCPSAAEAEQSAVRTLCQKVRRGYNCAFGGHQPRAPRCHATVPIDLSIDSSTMARQDTRNLDNPCLVDKQPRKNSALFDIQFSMRAGDGNLHTTL